VFLNAFQLFTFYFIYQRGTVQLSFTKACGSFMIDISLWRAVIGLWIFTRGIAKEKSTYTKINLTMDAKISYGYSKVTYSMYIMYHFLYIPYIALLLLCSRNVELNPGPTFIKCTSTKVGSIEFCKLTSEMHLFGVHTFAVPGSMSHCNITWYNTNFRC